MTVDTAPNVALSNQQKALMTTSWRKLSGIDKVRGFMRILGANRAPGQLNRLRIVCIHVWTARDKLPEPAIALVLNH